MARKPAPSFGNVKPVWFKPLCCVCGARDPIFGIGPPGLRRESDTKWFCPDDYRVTAEGQALIWTKLTKALDDGDAI